MNDYEGKRLFESWFIPDYGKPIGKGSFGTVYKLCSRDTKEVSTAVKIISIPRSKEEYNERIHQLGADVEEVNAEYLSTRDSVIKEVELMLKVSGFTNCVGCKAYSVEQHEDCFGWDVLIQMEMLESLDSYFRKKGTITNKDVIRLGIDTCKALEVCEEHNIVHRDIKPANIMVKSVKDAEGKEKNAHYKLGDFGVARIMNGGGSMTMSGTFEYMAPELVNGSESDHRVDIYSLGMVLYQLLNANRFPFMPDYPKAVSTEDRNLSIKKCVHGDKKPEPLYAAGTELAGVVLKACEHDRDKRYSTAAEMRKALEAAMQADEERTIFSVPPVGKYIPSERKFVVKINGRVETVPCDGKEHCAEGYTTNIKNHNIKIELKEGAAAKAAAKKPGKHYMGLTKDSFIVSSGEENLSIADVLVTDGYIEIVQKNGKTVKGKTAKDSKTGQKKKSKLRVSLAAAAVAIVALVCVFSIKSKKPAPPATTARVYDMELLFPEDEYDTELDYRLIGVWNRISVEDKERSIDDIPWDISIFSDGTYSREATSVSQGFEIGADGEKMTGLFEDFDVSYELKDITSSSETFYKDDEAANKFYGDCPNDQLILHVTGTVQTGPTNSYDVDSTIVYERSCDVRDWLQWRMVGIWKDNLGNTWEFLPDPDHTVSFSMTGADGTRYEGSSFDSSLKYDFVKFYFTENNATTDSYSIDYFDGNCLKLSDDKGDTLIMECVTKEISAAMTGEGLKVKLHLEPSSSASFAEVQHDAPIIIDRIRALASNAVVNQEEDGSINVELPLAVFGSENDIDTIIKAAISRPLALYFIKTASLGFCYDEGTLIDRSEIAEVSVISAENANKNYDMPLEYKDKYDNMVAMSQNQPCLLIKLTEEGAAKAELLAEDDGSLSFCTDAEMSSPVYFMNAFPAGDGVTFIVLPQTWDEVWSEQSVAEALAYGYSHEQLNNGFYYSYELSEKAFWENEGTTDHFGEYQCAYSELTGGTVTLTFSTYNPGEVSDETFGTIMKTFKDKLDIIGMPYAIGTGVQDQRAIVVCTSPEKLNPQIINFFTESALSYQVKSDAVNVYDLYTESMEIVENEETGTYGLKVQLSDAAALQKTTSDLFKLCPDKKIYLGWYGTDVLAAELYDIVYDGTLMFESSPVVMKREIGDNFKYILELSKYAYEAGFPPAFYSLEKCEFSNDEVGFGVSMLTEEEQNVLNVIAETHPETETWVEQDDTKDLIIKLHTEIKPGFLKTAFDTAEAIFRENKLDDMTFDYVIMQLIDETDETRCRLVFSWHTWNDSPYMACVGSCSGGLLDTYYDEFVKQAESRSFFSDREFEMQ